MKCAPIFCVTAITVALAMTGCGIRQPSPQTHPDDTTAPTVQPQPVSQTLVMPAQQVIELGGGVRLAIVLIPSGSFHMGDSQGLDDEQPVRRVTISQPFYLGQHEVTVEQFRRFVAATGYATDAEKGTGFRGAFGWDPTSLEFRMHDEYSWRNTGFPQEDDHPAVNVSWYDAMEFCHWLSRETGRTFRLPTEAEWEYACRAGTTTRYAHGNNPEAGVKVANIADAAFAGQFPELEGAVRSHDGFAYTSPAGSFAPNAFGLYDMHGNVWEWCADWYDVQYYADAPTHNPVGPSAGEERVYRGGGWFHCARGFRSASRSGDLPENRHLTLGFRVAVTLE
jgi:formylglycine-generating enzyme required for sulfatase activity